MGTMRKIWIENLLKIISMRVIQLRHKMVEHIYFLNFLSSLDIGRNVIIEKRFQPQGKGNIIIGDHSFIGKNVRLVVKEAQATIILAANVKIGENVQIICQSSGEIRIGKGSKIGKGTVITSYNKSQIYISENVNIQDQCELKTSSIINIGANSTIGKSTSIKPREENGDGAFICGEKCIIHEQNLFDTTDSIELEDEVATGPHDYFYTHDHTTKRDLSIWDQPIVKGKILIQKGSWIGSQVIILPDVRVGKGAVIAAGAVVNKPVDDYHIMAGIPARFIGERS